MKQVFRITLFLLSLMLAFSNSAKAGDAKGSYVSFGLGDVSCGSYAQMRRQPKGEDALAFDAWLSGYMTATNDLLANTYNIAGNTDRGGLLGWLDNYCQSNPTKKFAEAAEQLAKFLLPTRKQKADK